METILWLEDNAPNISGVAWVVKLPEEFVEMNCFSIRNSLIVKSAMEPNCITLNGGVAGHSACSRFYYSCIAGKLFQLQCPEGQAYDVKQKQCVAMEFMPECTTAEKPVLSTTGNPIQISKIIPAPELNDFCNTTGDGMFSAGCESYFYFCASGLGYHVKCPEGLFFDSETRNCNYKEHVLSCNLVLENSRLV
ncbi:hypothetical protein LOAG_16392 [Loa loa]|uniref:Chitin-binding type-2 domain-containing protein n=1 Tax=Loa loa TaxID=7209 RepID=A0A1S0UMM7_LOALO|nr:hypothetical protein LOAG_16392 [Loa loa]EJD76716.1 hypothetical protein LOAG_16392 [Loa loa]